MSSHNIKLDSSKLTAELFYSAFLNLPDIEKETFISRLLNSLNSKTVAVDIFHTAQDPCKLEDFIDQRY